MPTAGSRKALQETQSLEQQGSGPVSSQTWKTLLHNQVTTSTTQRWESKHVPHGTAFSLRGTQLSSHFTTNKGISGMTTVYIQWPPNKTVQIKTSLLIPKKRHGTQARSSLCMKISNSEDPRSLPLTVLPRSHFPTANKNKASKTSSHQPPLLLLSPVFSTVLASNTSRGLAVILGAPRKKRPRSPKRLQNRYNDKYCGM